MFTYDDDGRLIKQTGYDLYNVTGIRVFETKYNYDGAGVLRAYSTSAFDRPTGSEHLKYTQFYLNSYLSADSYLLTQQSARTVQGNTTVMSGLAKRNYNANRELVSTEDTKETSNNRYFVNDANGQALTVVRGNYTTQSAIDSAMSSAFTQTNNAVKAHFFFFANGQQAGSVGQLGNENPLQPGSNAHFDVNYTSALQQTGPTSVTEIVAREGETLRMLAQRVYGDASLWYLIADENGLTDPTAALAAGRILRLPNTVVSLSNNAETFKPFNPAEAIGDTTPTQAAPPMKDNNCGMIAQIIVMVVAIIVSIYLGPEVIAAAEAAMGPVGAAVAAGFVGVIGNAAGQGVAIAVGAQSRFDWKSAAMSGISAGVLQGVAPLGVGGSLAKGMGFAEGSLGARIVSQAADGALVSALTQGVAVATGLQKSFSWKEVAISAVSAPVSSAVGGQVAAATGSQFLSDFASSVAGSLVRGAIDGKVDARRMLADAFGNAIGNAIGGLIGGAARSGADDQSSSSGAADYLGEPVLEKGRGDAEQDLALSPDEQAQLQEIGYRNRPGAGGAVGADGAVARPIDDANSSASNSIGSSQAAQEWIGGDVSTLPEIVVTGVREPLIREDYFAARLRIGSLARRPIASGIRLFNADQIKYHRGSYDGRYPLPELNGHLEFQGKLGRAEEFIPGESQLMAVFPEGMPRGERLDNSIRIAGGYLPDEVIDDLLYQINTGSDAVDLTYARGYSMMELEARAQAANIDSIARRLSMGGGHPLANSMIYAEMARQGRDGLRAQDPLLPPVLNLTEKGVMSETWKAVDRALWAASIVDVAAAVPMMFARLGVRASTKPAWLVRLEQGNAFNEERRNAYQFREVYIDNPRGGYFKLDGYSLTANEIVSRKFTQFANIMESTGVKYINEIAAKYPVGARISNVKTNISKGLAGQRLAGRYILEIPVQTSPVPQAILDAAKNASVKLRDVAGRVY
jgi:hypothetical protein